MCVLSAAASTRAEDRPRFAAFMVGDKCDGINAILKKYLDKPLDGDDVCFDVVTELNSGAWLLMPAALVASVLAQALLRRAHAQLHERSQRARAKRRALERLDE